MVKSIICDDFRLNKINIVYGVKIGTAIAYGTDVERRVGRNSTSNSRTSIMDFFSKYFLLVFRISFKSSGKYFAVYPGSLSPTAWYVFSRDLPSLTRLECSLPKDRFPTYNKGLPQNTRSTQTPTTNMDPSTSISFNNLFDPVGALSLEFIIIVIVVLPWLDQITLIWLRVFPSTFILSMSRMSLFRKIITHFR